MRSKTSNYYRQSCTGRSASISISTKFIVDDRNLPDFVKLGGPLSPLR